MFLVFLLNSKLRLVLAEGAIQNGSAPSMLNSSCPFFTPGVPDAAVPRSGGTSRPGPGPGPNPMSYPQLGTYQPHQLLTPLQLGGQSTAYPVPRNYAHSKLSIFNKFSQSQFRSTPHKTEQAPHPTQPSFPIQTTHDLHPQSRLKASEAVLTYNPTPIASLFTTSSAQVHSASKPDPDTISVNKKLS